ncbi:MAG: cellulase N-terminal Ig-like domain-containing protein, partial [Balneolales bacterium]
MKVNCYLSLLTGLLLFGCASANETNQTVYPQTDGAGSFELNELEYFQNRGVGVMPFLDTAPESHQGGVIMVMHGTRIATNGDLRLEATPGQWSPVPVQQERIVDYENQEVRATMTYPDPNQNMQGFNPIYYPDLDLKYDVIVSADGDDINIRVDLDWPIPEEFVGEVGFTMEFYPHDLFGKSWHMDEQAGIFPMQAYGVTAGYDSTPTPEILPSGDLKSYLPLPNHQAKPVPLATGRTLTIAPESEKFRTQISTRHGELELLDGRVQHQNGWFIVRSTVEAGATDGAIEWTISPNVIPDWVAEPVLQYSQVGYHPGQDKVAVIETDPNDQFDSEIQLVRLKANGQHEVIRSEHPEAWGDFLRYQYYQFDFSDVTADGMYQLVLDDQKSEVFRISNDVYAQNVWQPTLDYFLPVQMCHMRVKEKYKLWHDVCHLDDALMAPKDINHFDGYVQGASTLTDYKPMDHVPGLNQGGWHDAGDDDLRIESQSGEVFILSAAYDEFHVIRDNSLIDWNQNLVEIREPDGDPDILQQIEHGLRNIVGGYESMGRLYRGVIVPTLTQYVMGGEGLDRRSGR